jgi:cellulose synthase/poly-beta-1,6-N-acetylglucosamine synthase-like glycosyltransferase
MTAGGWVEWVALCCAALVVYTFAGYPLVVAAWARWRPRPVTRVPMEPPVTIVVVAHGEGARIDAKLASCLAQDYPVDRLQVLVVSDGSTDDTAARVAAHDPARVRLLAFDARRGKPACLNDAVAATRTDFVVFTDARQRLHPQAVRHLLENFADPQVGAVSGELVFQAEGRSEFAQGVDAYWRYEKFIRRSEARVHSVPGVTGALYAMRRACFRPIPVDTILDDVAIPMQALRGGWRVVFDERAIAYDHASQTPAQERTRKLRTLAGNVQLIVRMPWVLLPGLDPIAWQFVSHKALRLVAPFALLGLLVASAVLAPHSRVAAVLLASQLAFYALPVVGRVLPRLGRWWPTRLARAFVHLNAYAAAAVPVYLMNRRPQLWKAAAVPPDQTRTGS